MKRSVRKVLPIVTGFAAMIALAGACDRAQVAEPEMVQLEQMELDQLQFSTTYNVNGFKVVKGSAGEGSVTQVIDAKGGMLVLGRQILVVPWRAVSGPTEFTMAAVADGSVHVDLTATSVGSAVANDVGKAGFKRPVFLKLSYSDAETPSDVARLAMAWLRDSGSVEGVPSYVDKNGEWVIGMLRHFSGYIIVAN